MPLNANQLQKIDFSITTSDSLQFTIKILRASIPDNEKNVVLTINKLLQTAKTRRTGLELINALIDYSSIEVLTENVAHWASHCAIPHPQDNSKEIKLQTTEKIIKRMSGTESFNKKFMTDYLSDTVKACLVYTSNSEKNACLRCLIQCMRTYPSWFGNHKEKIESFLIKFLESGQESVEDAALAFHLFQQTGSGGVEGVNYINNFRNCMKKLCATVHVLYDSFFTNVQEVDNSEKIDSDTFNLNEISNTEKVASTIFNCLCFIKIMIARGFPVEKQMVPKYILDVINRGLSIHICLSEENITLEKTQQSLLLNKIQVQLLKILRIFIIGNQSSVLPFSYIINKLLVNVLKRTNNCKCFMNDKTYKITTYKTLACWLALGRNVNNSRLQEMLVPLLLKDISPVKKKIKLNLTQSNKKRSKQQVLVGTVESLTPISEDSCIYALDILKCIFSMYPVATSQQLLDEVTLFVVKTLAEIQTNRADPPYTSRHSQLKLYEVLISFMKQEQNKVRVPIHLVASVLQSGMRSEDYRISQVSRDGLELLEKISHPVCPSLALGNASEPQKQSEVILETLEELSDVSEENIEIEDDTSDKIVVVEEKEKNGVINGDTVEEEKRLEEIVIEKEITVISNIIISDSNDCQRDDAASTVVRTRTTSDEPPTKKKKDDLEDMFASFQDVIQ